MKDSITLQLEKEQERCVGSETYKTYDFHIFHPENTNPIGVIDLRNSYHLEFTLYHGNIGYEIDPQWRRRGYATQACQLLRPFALSKGMNILWITCSPANMASIKTIDKLGAQFLGNIKIPTSHTLRKNFGIVSKRRYKWQILK